MLARFFKQGCRQDWVFSIIFVITIYFSVIYSIPTYAPKFEHDDGLFISQALSIASGNWLGEDYGVLTLIKGPYHSIQIWLSSLIGLPPLLGLRIFYAASSIFFCSVALRSLPTFLKSLALVCLLFDPVLIGSEVGWRLLRAASYVPIELLALTFGIYSLDTITSITTQQSSFNLKKQRIVACSIILAYFFLGLLLITREARIVVISTCAVYTFLLLRQVWKSKLLIKINSTKLISIVLVTILAFNVPVVSIRLLNQVNYGLAISNEFEEGNFKSFYEKLSSVKIVDSEYQPFIPIKQESINMIISLSGTNELASTLSNLNEVWIKHGCLLREEWCNEYASGWFMWALRDAIFRTFDIKSPAVFQAKVIDLSSRLDELCNSSSEFLTCARSTFGYLPYPSRWTSNDESLAMIILDSSRALFNWIVTPNLFNYNAIAEENNNPARIMGVSLPSDNTLEELNRSNQKIVTLNKLSALLRKSLLSSFFIIVLISVFCNPRLLSVFFDTGLIYILTFFMATFIVIVLVHVTSFPAYVYLSLASPLLTLFIWRYYDRLISDIKFRYPADRALELK